MTPPPKSTANPLLRCFAIYRRFPWLFAGATAVVAAVNLSLPWQQWLIGRAIHDVEQGVAVVRLADGGLDTGRAWWWMAVLLAISLGRGALQWLGTVLSMFTGQRLLFHLRDEVLAQVQRLDLGYHLAHGAGEIVTRTTRDSDKVRDAVTGGWRTLLDVSLIVAGSLAMLCWYDPLLGLVPAALVGIALVMFLRQADRLVALDRAAGDAYDVVTQELGEGVGGVRVIKAFALEDARIARFTGLVDSFAGRARAALRFYASRVPLPQLVVAFSHVWVLAYGAELVAAEKLNIGELVAAMMVITAVIFRVEGIGRVMQTFADARSSAERITELLDAVPAIAGGGEPLPAGPLGLRFANVTVKPPGGGNAILDRLDLELRPGEVVALVGATGSGKSTLASLLPRLRDVDGGAVQVGSPAAGWHDLRQLELPALRRRVQVVYQDSFLFTDSLANNLRLSDPAASEDDIRAALRLAAADEVLATLNDGLNSRIGERGVTLSGGQRQRVCLARALLARPAILCADDATSALDAVTERRILDNLRAWSVGAGAATTVILIASKLSTILLADRVLMLSGGRIAAQGRHADLLRDDAAYRDLLGLDEEERR